MRQIVYAKRKLDWAYKHLQSLDVALFNYYTSNPYTVTRKDDLEAQLHIARFRVPEPDPIIYLILGDALYNMRSCLDQLVWSLAASNGIPGRTSFPIVDIATFDKLKSLSENIAGVPDEAVCEIKFLQPYHRGDAYKTHPLWRLNELSNLDKHRRTPQKGSAYHFNFPNFPKEHFSEFRAEVTDDGGIVIVPLALKDKLEFDPNVPIEIRFGGDKSGIDETPRSLGDIYKFVANEVLPRFERFFPNVN